MLSFIFLSVELIRSVKGRIKDRKGEIKNEREKYGTKGRNKKGRIKKGRNKGPKGEIRDEREN